MHIYAYGSICRGEISSESDVDLLYIVDHDNKTLNAEIYSVYTYARLKEMWSFGNPFSWHLFLEAKLIYSSDENDYLKNLGSPKKYSNFDADHVKFSKLLNDSANQINTKTRSYVFELSNIFLAIRNLAICYSLCFLEQPTFSRHSALSIKEKSIILPDDIYSTLERARILCSRGIGDNLETIELQKIRKYFPYILNWAVQLKNQGDTHE